MSVAAHPKKSADSAGTPARRGALRLLEAVLVRGQTLEQAAKPALRKVDGPADRALALAIANEALRWLADIDAAIDSATRKRLPDQAPARMVLRLMLAQWLRLDTPPHAVIATGLPLLSGGQRKLAHGVFSALAKQGLALPDYPTLPDSVQARWGALAQEVAPGLAKPPPLDLTLREPEQTKAWVEKLGGESLARGHLRLPRGTPVERLPGYGEGAWWVQDLAASLPARLLGAGEGRRALDLCAAPGGKTMQLAAAGWQVTAVDSAGHRLERLRENLRRTGLEAETIKADIRHWQPAKTFDTILLDAPCTATGTCRRHPDVLHRIGGKDVSAMAELQSELLTKAAGWLPEGGTLVYAVCSLEEREGERIAGMLELSPLPITPDELPMGLQPTAEGHVRTHPGMLPDEGGLDGFFIARWRR